MTGEWITLCLSIWTRYLPVEGRCYDHTTLVPFLPFDYTESSSVRRASVSLDLIFEDKLLELEV